MPSALNTLRSTVLATPLPTISYSLTAPTNQRWALPWKEVATFVGMSATFNPSLGILDIDNPGGLQGIEFFMTGSQFTFGWRTQTSGAERCMLFINGAPCMATPATPTVSTSASQYAYMTVTLANAVQDAKVEVLVTNIFGAVGLYTPSGSFTRATPVKYKTMCYGDSFFGGSDAVSSTTETIPAVLALRNDLSIANNSLGGTGYVTDNGIFKRFGDPSRIAVATLFAPDKIILMGSVNDDTKSGIQAAAEDTYVNLRAAVPGVKLTVYGPQPTSAEGTVGAARRANNQAVQAACAAQNVNFIDLIGNAGSEVIEVFVNSGTYQPMQLVTHLGSVWQHDATAAGTYPAAYAPGNGSLSGVWKLLTRAGYYGTGRVGAPASNGSRDTLLYSDNVHPTAAGSANFASELQPEVV